MEHAIKGWAASGESAAEDQQAAVEWIAIAHYMVPTEAYLMRGCLQSCGVPAEVADDQHIQANLLIAPALGGVRLLVPAPFLDEAKALLAAHERGELALDDDADVGAAD
jgi:hypothetical protein